MKSMPRKLTAVFICAFLFSISIVKAQPVLFQDPVTSKTFDSEKYSDIKGSPFLFEQWMAGSLITSKGIYKNLELKLDAYSNTVYLKKDNQPYEIQEAVQGFTLFPNPADSSRSMTFRKNALVTGIRPDQYVQVLSEGKISLYKSDIKLLSEISEINKGVVKTFSTSSRYYIVKNGASQLIKLNKKELLAVMQDKSDQVQQYIKEKDLNVNKEEGAKAIINYYNSL